MAHEMTLLSTEVRTLRAANEALSKRRRAKKTYVRQGGTLTVEDAQDIIAQKDVDEQVRRDVRAAGGSRKEGQFLNFGCSDSFDSYNDLCFVSLDLHDWL
jgi:hypothetical protein